MERDKMASIPKCPLPASPPDPSGPSSPSSGGHLGSNATGSFGRTLCPDPQHGGPGCRPEPPGVAYEGQPAGTPLLWGTQALQGTKPHLHHCFPAWGNRGGQGGTGSWMSLVVQAGLTEYHCSSGWSHCVTLQLRLASCLVTL